MLNEESAPFNNYKISFNEDSSCLKLFELTNKNEGMYTCVADNYVDKIASSAKLKLKNLKSESKLSKNVNEKKMQEIPPTNKSLTLHLDENEIIDVDKTVSRENYFNENYKNKLQQDDEQSDTFLSHKTDESLTTLVEKNSNIQDKEIIFEKDRCEHEIEKCTKNLDVNIENDANLETDATKFLDESFDKILNEMPIYDHFNPNCYLSAPFHNGALNGDLQSTESDQYDMHHVEASMNHMYKDSFDMTDVNTTYASALSTITETYEDSN
ncbi:hypothetical protein A3Q56_05903 [Intoshia linei]|uniref:Immunoglobulin I-set domain-containing protein n=1 Tax=Intoshia linei TaxID=1819745 RepID=A0A177AWK8_9BILA|nr:hypothetical protein A3Q56_05903 [Intoshia linei]